MVLGLLAGTLNLESTTELFDAGVADRGPGVRHMFPAA
jgi:hypothetical protein